MRQEMKLLTLLTAAALASPVLAQVISPGALQQLRIDEEERRRAIERLDQLRGAEPKVEVPAAKPAPKSDPNALRIMVREIRFTKSEIFSAEELKAFARDHEGREQSLSDLQAMVDVINNAYRKRNIVTAQAVIPPQDVSSGVIEIRLIEGHLGSIRIKGNDSTAVSYITNRIGLRAGDLISLPVLEDSLLRFNRTNDVQLQAQLVPGQSFGTTDLNLDAKEPPHHVLRSFIDNSGSRSTGEIRGGLTYYNRSVFGFRDEFSASTTQSHGQESYSASYAIPVNRWGGRLSLAYFQDYTQIKHGRFASLNITGESKSTVLSLRQPVLIDKSSQLDLLAGAKTRRVDNWISGVFLNTTETVDGNLGAEFQHADTSGTWLGSYSYTYGQVQTNDDESYGYGRGWLRRQQQLPKEWSLIGSASFQHSRKPLLPSSEQFVIGGEGTVRGYPVATYSGDTGYTLSVELHHPIGKTGFGSTQLAAAGFFFIDYGYTRPYRPTGSTLRSYEQLTSGGWGINAALGNHISARLTFAYAPDSLQDPMRSHLSTLFQLVGTFY